MRPVKYPTMPLVMAIVYWSYDMDIYVMDATFKVARVGLSQEAAGICYCQCSPDDLNAVESAALTRNQYRVAMV